MFLFSFYFVLFSIRKSVALGMFVTTCLAKAPVLSISGCFYLYFFFFQKSLMYSGDVSGGIVEFVC